MPSDKKDGAETMTIDFDSDKSGINIISSNFSSDKSDSDYENEMLKIGVETYDIPAIEFGDYEFSVSKDAVKKFFTDHNTPQTDKEKEAILYARAAGKEYYPSGSFEQINRENNEALNDLFSKDTTWYEKLNAGLSLIDPTGVKANLKNGLNRVRYDLSIRDNNTQLNPVYGNKKEDIEFEDEQHVLDGSVESNGKTNADFETDKVLAGSIEKDGKANADFETDKVLTGSVESDKKEDSELKTEVDIAEKDELEIKKQKLHDYDDADDYASMPSTRKTRMVLLSEEGKAVNNYYSSGIEETKKSPIDNNYSSGIEEEARDLPSVGTIYVAPSITDLNPDLFFKIPLQNNLAFQTMSRVASYNSMSFFNRIGDIKQYSGTGPIEEIEVTTEYFVDGSNDYTMDKLQEIEMKYRSLVLPSEYNEDEGSDNPIRYTRPPVIYIVLGKKDSSSTEDSSAYADFNYEKNKVYNNFFTEIKANDNNKLKYRTFVVTRVNINKDTEKYDYYVDTTSKEYYDTTGFSVSMQILEIDDNYISGAPSFDDYCNIINEA